MSGLIQGVQNGIELATSAASHATGCLYHSIVSVCKKVAGEGNINEFLPYTIVSIANKVFYSTVFAIYYNDVVNGGGDSSNGVTYDSKAINNINASSVVVTGAALTLLCVLSTRNSLRFRRVVAREAMPEEMRARIRRDILYRELQITHTVIASLVNMVNGFAQITALGAFGSSEKLKQTGLDIAKDTAVPALILILSKNALDCAICVIQLIAAQQNSRSLAKLLPSEHGDLVRSLVISVETKASRLKAAAASTGLVTFGMTVLLIGTLGKMDVTLAVPIFLGTATAGQAIPVYNKTKQWCLMKCKDTNSSLTQGLLGRGVRDIGEVMQDIMNGLIAQEPWVSDVLAHIRLQPIGSTLNPIKEAANGLEGLTKSITLG